MMPSIHEHPNVIASMLYQRGERTSTPGIRSITRAQVENVVKQYNLRERTSMTVREMLRVETDRWSIEPTMQPDQFLISQKGF